MFLNLVRGYWKSVKGRLPNRVEGRVDCGHCGGEPASARDYSSSDMRTSPCGALYNSTT